MPRVLKKYLLLNLILMAFPLAAFAQDIPRTADGTPFLQGFWQAQTQAAYNLEDHVARHDMPAGLSVVARWHYPLSAPGTGQAPE